MVSAAAAVRIRITATPLYPGSFFPEDGHPRVIANTAPDTALAAVEDDGAWFCIVVRKVEQKRWTDGLGNEMWTDEGQPSSSRIYIGETFTAEEIEQWPDAETYRTLVANMRGNDWPRVVRTRRGNFQPLEHEDVAFAKVPTR